jgi:hypothetical protein
VVVSRAIVDATIYGGRGRWPLRTRTTSERRDVGWQAVRSVAASG